MTSYVSLQTTSDGLWGIGGSAAGLLRYPPEPRNTAGTWLKNVTGAVTSAAGSIASGIGGDRGLQTLIQEQIRVQQQMQVYSAQSNILRSQHETEMTPIRNMRLG
jgi:hypothetical protein